MSHWEAQNALQWEKLHFLLDHRERPAVLWVTCNSFRHRKQLQDTFKVQFSHFQHHEIDLKTYAGQSAKQFFQASLPPAVNGSMRVIHVGGLETLVAAGAGKDKTKLFEALNFEREVLFHELSAHLVFWTESFSQLQVQRYAPDFWDWLIDKITFEYPPVIPEYNGGIWDHDTRAVAGEQRHELVEQTLRYLQSLDSPDTPATDQLSLLEAISENYFQLQDYRQAWHYIEKALALSGEGVSTYLRNLAGHTLLVFGEYDRAKELYEINLTYYQKVGDLVGEGVALNDLGQIFQALGDYETALRHLEKSLKISRQIGSRNEEGTTLNNIGGLFIERGEYDKAIQFLEKSLSIRSEIGDKIGEATTLNNISQVYQMRGELNLALVYLNRSIGISQEIGARSIMAKTLNNIGTIFLKMKSFSEAKEYFEKSMQLYTEIGDQEGTANELANIGNIYFQLNEYNISLQYLQNGLSIMQKIGKKSKEGTILNNIGQVYLATGDHDTALNYISASLQIQREIGGNHNLAVALSNIAAIFFERKGNIESALPLFWESYKIFQRIGSPNDNIPSKYLNAIRAQLGEARFNEILASLPDDTH